MAQAKQRKPTAKGPFASQRNCFSKFEWYPCKGTINVYFPPEGQSTFNNTNCDVMLKITHEHHLGRDSQTGIRIPVREWLQNNKHPIADTQRDELLHSS
jgi:hypothetical protein